MPNISMQLIGMDDVETSVANKRFARIVYVVPLPFRLRMGPDTLHRLNLSDEFEVYVHNLIPIPLGTNFEIQWHIDSEIRKKLPLLKMSDSMMSEVLVIDRKPGISDENVRLLIERHRAGQPFEGNDGGKPDRLFLALSALNDVIVSYHLATGALIGGRTVQRLGLYDWVQRLSWQHVLLCPPEREVTNDECVDLIKGRSPVPAITNSPPGVSFDFADLPSATPEAINKKFRLHKKYPFYQFNLDAKTKLMEHELPTALLFSVAALEGAHAVILRRCLKRLLGAQNVPKGADIFVAERAEALLVSSGFSEVLDVTSMILLDPSDRPSYEHIRECKLGVTIRNEIMHVVTKGSGYKISNRTEKQIRESCNAVIRIYEHFISLLEKDEPTEEQTFIK